MRCSVAVAASEAEEVAGRLAAAAAGWGTVAAVAVEGAAYVAQV